AAVGVLAVHQPVDRGRGLGGIPPAAAFNERCGHFGGRVDSIDEPIAHPDGGTGFPACFLHQPNAGAFHGCVHVAVEHAVVHLRNVELAQNHQSTDHAGGDVGFARV